MALKACKECGGQVSTKAAACPHCGAKGPLEASGFARIAVGVLSVFIVGSIIAAFASFDSEPRSSQRASAAAAPASAPEHTEAQLLAWIEGAKVGGDHGAVINWSTVFLRSYPNSASAASVRADQQAATDARAAAAAEAIADRRWSYRDDTDPMTGAVTSVAQSASLNTFELGFPYAGQQRGRLLMRDHPRHGLDVIVSIERGQVLCRSYSNCRINVRFDDGEVIRYRGAESDSSDSNLAFITDASDFIHRAKIAQRVLIELQIYQHGTVVLEFDTSRFTQQTWNHG